MQYGFTPENKVGSWANGWNFNNGKFLPASGMRYALSVCTFPESVNSIR